MLGNGLLISAHPRARALIRLQRQLEGWIGLAGNAKVTEFCLEENVPERVGKKWKKKTQISRI